MGETEPDLSTEEMAELSGLADGTLPAGRRAALERRVAASPELQRLLERQRRALAATKVMAAEPMPDSLRARVGQRLKALSGRPRAGWRLWPTLAAGGSAAALAIVLARALSGGPAGPSVADAARLASLPPNGPAPASANGSRTELAIGVEGVAFANLLHSHGWRAVGVRRDQIDGRDATAVYYAKGMRRIAYVIVAGSGLPQPSDARSSVRDGVEYKSLRIDDRPAVTWRRAGHTCVLIGKISTEELLELAAWQGNGASLY
jgi:anti-sigma factor RsiW